MDKFVEIFQNLVIKTISQAYKFIVQFTPKIVFSLLVLLIGWVCALLLKKITAKLLKALGFDILSEKTGFKHFLEKGDIVKPLSSIVGLVFYWLILFSALIMVFNTLGVEAAVRLIEQTIFYLPKVIVALIVIALGIFLSQFINKFVQTSARLANIPFYTGLGRLAHYITVAVAIMLALEYLGVTTAVIMHYAVIVFIVVPLIVSLIFIIGGKDIISSILAARLLKREYKKGDTIEFDSVSGQIDSIDSISTKIRNKDGKIIIPNSELIKKIVIKLGGDGK